MTAAVDREALAEWLYTELEYDWDSDQDRSWPNLRSQDLYRWRAIAGQLLEHWDILDVDQVRHDHGERIAQHFEETTSAGTVLLPVHTITAEIRAKSPTPEAKL